MGVRPSRVVSAALALVFAVVCAASAVLVAPQPVAAVTALSWVGGHGSAWSTAANWSPAQTPSNGDTLSFPVDVTATNDLSGLVVGGIDLAGGDTIDGVLFELGGTLASTGSNVVAAPIRVTASRTSFTSGARLELQAPISGPGGVAFQGSQFLLNGSGANTYQAGSQFAAAAVELDRAGGEAVPAGAVDVGGLLRQDRPDQISDQADLQLLSPDAAYWTTPVDTAPDPFDTVRSITSHGAQIVLAATIATTDLSLLGSNTGGTTPAGVNLVVDVNNGANGRFVVSGAATVDPSTRLLVYTENTPPPDQTFTIIDRTSSGPIPGSFQYPEGWSFQSTSSYHPYRLTATYRISYRGGDGNDSTITSLGLNERSVRFAYQLILGRSPDPGGLVHWTSYLDGGGSIATMALALARSTEGRARTVERAYQDLLGRPADTAGRNYWVDFLGHGGTVDVLRATLIGSNEFRRRPGAGTTAGFLDALYRLPSVLNRAPDPGGLAYWQQQIDTGRVDRTAVALVFLQSGESADVNARPVANFLAGDTFLIDATVVARFYQASGGDIDVAYAVLLTLWPD